MAVYQYNREALLAKLRLVEAAISKSAHLPTLQQVFFTDGALLACNDKIALATSFEEAPQIGVDGIRLIKLLATTTADSVQFTLQDNGALRLDAQKFTVLLHASHDEPPFRWPAPEDLPALYISKEMGERLDLTRKVVIPTSPKPQARGVTLVRDKAGAVTFYATDSKTMLKLSFLDPAAGTALPCKTVLTMASVEVLAKIAPGWLRVAPGYVLFDTDEDDLSLWGRTIQPDDWLDWERALQRKRMSDELQPIPIGFGRMMKRAGVMLPRDSQGRKRCKLRFDGSNMTVLSTGPAGDLEDYLPCEHSAVTLTVDQSLVERLWAKCEFGQLGASLGGLFLTSGSGDIGYMMSAPSGLG